MKVGDLVIYKWKTIPNSNGHWESSIGVVFYINPEGGTIKMLTTDGLEKWCVISYCEVIA